MTIKLDTRAARCDLTSRECCKLICGALAGAIGAGMDPEALRRVIEVSNLATNAELTPDTLDRFIECLKGLTGQSTSTMAMLGAVLGAISEQAAPSAMQDASNWILEQGSDFWEALALPAKAIGLGN